MFILNVEKGNENSAKTPRTKTGEVKLNVEILVGSKKVSQLAAWVGPEQARIAKLEAGKQYCCDNIKLVDNIAADGTVIQQPVFEGLMLLGNSGAMSFQVMMGLASMGKTVPTGFPGWDNSGATAKPNTGGANTPAADLTADEQEAAAKVIFDTYKGAKLKDAQDIFEATKSYVAAIAG